MFQNCVMYWFKGWSIIEGYNMRFAVSLVVVLILLLDHVKGDDHRTRTKRSTLLPKLQITTSHINVTSVMSSGTRFQYKTDIRHSPDSKVDGRGVHVTWMLAPFLLFKGISSWFGPKPRVTQVGDSVMFVLQELLWMQDAHFTFDVVFDHNSMLKTGRHHVVTPVELRYYKDYVEDYTGKITSKGVLYAEPLVTHEIVVEVPGCSSALGMTSKEIADYQITASSSYSDAQPSQAREGDDAWCAFVTNDQQYIQVDFRSKTRIGRIVTYGRRTKLFWVTKYSLQYSSDEKTWQFYQENGFTKVYQANQDRFTPKSYLFREPIEAYSLRIRPLAWERLICMRFELYGCGILGSPLKCIEPLGLESGDIPDEALAQSTDASIYTSSPGDIRLNKKVTEYPNGWQAALGVLDYLQIDFGSLRKVTRIASQGGYNVPYYVSGFKLKYSNNSIDWIWYKVDGVEEEIKGPKDSYEAKRPVLSKLVVPFVCRYLRIIPTAAASLKIMRAEVYGCNAEQLPPYKGLPEYSRRSFILDPSTNMLFVCMYTYNRFESSCLSTKDGKEWNGIESFIIGIVAYNPTLRHLYGLDRSMNYYRTSDQGETWVAMSSEHFKKMRHNFALTMASGVPDNVTSTSPPGSLSITSANGIKWGASGAGIHMMTAGSNTWTTVGSWRCCGD